MFDSSDVQSVFSGNIAEEWEKKSRYINSLNGDIVNIGLHFILKNVRPYAASCSEA